jgi:hypothetical protein
MLPVLERYQLYLHERTCPVTTRSERGAATRNDDAPLAPATKQTRSTDQDGWQGPTLRPLLLCPGIERLRDRCVPCASLRGPGESGRAWDRASIVLSRPMLQLPSHHGAIMHTLPRTAPTLGLRLDVTTLRQLAPGLIDQDGPAHEPIVLVQQ